MKIIDMCKEYVSEQVKEFYRYMDTTVPLGVNRELFTDLKYTNREKIRQFESEYENIDRTLIDNVALRDFLSLSDEEKLSKIDKYRECQA